MNLNEFLTAYTQTMMEKMVEHSYGIDAMGVQCAACPLREQCHSSEEDSMGCAEFILSKLTDGNRYRA